MAGGEGQDAGLLPVGTPVGVISPHMDDAALSCGDLLSDRPGSHVVTVFSGGPAQVRPLPSWDELSGAFKPGDDVMGMRAVEDDAAMGAVGATGHRLDFWDEQYRAGEPVRHARYRPLAVRARQRKLDDPVLIRQIDEKLAGIVAKIGLTTWFVPLGLWHGDHQKTTGAGLRLAASRPELTWLVYEELPYRKEVPEQVAERMEVLKNGGFSTRPVVAPKRESASAKRAMIACYRSQVTCLGARVEAAVSGPEVYHLLSGRGR